MVKNDFKNESAGEKNYVSGSMRLECKVKSECFKKSVKMV